MKKKLFQDTKSIYFYCLKDQSLKFICERTRKNLEKGRQNLEKWAVPKRAQKGLKRVQNGSKTRSGGPLDPGFRRNRGGPKKVCFFGKNGY